MVRAQITLPLASLALLTLAACNPFGGGGNPFATQSSSPAAVASTDPSAAPTKPPPSAAPAMAGGIDYGDDASQFARDGECDDKRFTGAGMTSTPLLESDIRHDATDCRVALEQGRLQFQGNVPTNTSNSGSVSSSHIQWGDDSSKYARDGECDDKRFTGPGMTATPLLDSDIQHDATDCRVSFEQGRLQLRM